MPLDERRPDPILRRPATALAGLAVVAAFLTSYTPTSARGAWLWVEGEKAFSTRAARHPYWYDRVKRSEFSGGDYLSNWHPTNPAEAGYRVIAPTAGDYDFWVRANPVQTRLSYKLNDAPWAAIATDREPQQSVNVAEDGKPDLRFLAWLKVGRVRLTKGPNVVRFRMHSENNNHGYLDCFVLANEPFTPKGALRPDQIAFAKKQAEARQRGWFAFEPGPDAFREGNPIDLRSLNEKVAGDGGFIAAKEGRFVHSSDGRPVRFWAVNGPAGKEFESLRREARQLAKRGVNLVRVHRPIFDERGQVDPELVTQAGDVVAAMKAEGIYTHFSIYFPIWFKPRADNPWLAGYDGTRPAFAALMFNKGFQEAYRAWWTALLRTPQPRTGKLLIEDPAVFGVEIQNEDSFFFWTFDEKTIPDPQLRLIEARFGDWLTREYGSIETAAKRWGPQRLPRDRPAEGRMALRPNWNIAHEKTTRDKDTARFLAETQRAFYLDTYRFLRLQGFKGQITASNWTTASPEILGPLEKYSYAVTDFIDRHGYFGCNLKGENADWSIRDGQTYADRSALRFDGEAPGGPKVFSHPAADITYADKPSMISETTWNRPNRYRGEAPLFYAAYGALQGSDAVVHFAYDGADWSVKPAFFMQPWTLMTPAMVGQFPAAALIFRKGLVDEGDLLADVNLRPSALFDLQGTPLPQDAALDELRLKDVPTGGQPPRVGQIVDPLIHFAGRTRVRFNENGGPTTFKDLSKFVDRAGKTVRSTNDQLRLDWGHGLLAINAPSAQGYSGNLRAASAAPLDQLSIESTLDLGHVVAVSLDDRPLSTSGKILLQVMTEEAAAGFRTEPLPGGGRKIASIGADPWMVREIEGVVRFQRPDAATLKVSALDPNGEPVADAGKASAFRLLPSTMYYLIEPVPPARPKAAATPKPADPPARRPD